MPELSLHDAGVQDAWKLFNATGGTELIIWMVYVYIVRKDQNDSLGGQWGALSLGLAMLGVVIGAGLRIHSGQLLTVASIPITMSICAGFVWQWKYIRGKL